MDSYTAALKISYENAMKDLMDLKEKADLFVSRIDMLDAEQKKDMKRIAELEVENKKLKEEKEFFYKSAKQFREENKKLREELSAYDREYFDEDKKAENIYKSQKENILMGKI